MTTKTKPFQITRVPALNGEWVDLHISEGGKLCINTSGYAEIDHKELLIAINTVQQS